MECGVFPDIQRYSTNFIKNQGREGGDLIAILMLMAAADGTAQGGVPNSHADWHTIPRTVWILVMRQNPHNEAQVGKCRRSVWGLICLKGGTEREWDSWMAGMENATELGRKSRGEGKPLSQEFPVPVISPARHRGHPQPWLQELVSLHQH